MIEGFKFDTWHLEKDDRLMIGILIMSLLKQTDSFCNIGGFFGEREGIWCLLSRSNCFGQDFG